MRRFLLLFALALVAAAASFAIYSHQSESKTPRADESGELMWLRTEFSVTDAQFDEIRRMHEEYKPICQDLCDRIIAAKADLGSAILGTERMSAEVDEALDNYLQVKEECHRRMLEHAYRVAEILPASERERYLSEVRAQVTFLEPGY